MDELNEILLKVMDKAGYVGAILVALIALWYLLAQKHLVPKMTRRVSATLLVITFVFFGIAMFLPTLEKYLFGVRTLDVILKTEDGKLASLEFTLKFRLEDRGVLTARGHEGVAEVRGVNTGLNALDVVTIEAPGWSMRDKPPFDIKGGQVNVVVVKQQTAPPESDTTRPDPSVFRPSKSDLQAGPVVSPDKVTLHYANRTSKPLDLVLYPYAEFEDDSNPWKVKAKWLDFPLDQTSSSATTIPPGNVYDQFKTGNGWFGIWIRDSQKRYWPMGAHNLFVAKEVWLQIEAAETDNDESPYHLQITEDGPRD